MYKRFCEKHIILQYFHIVTFVTWLQNWQVGYWSTCDSTTLNWKLTINCTLIPHTNVLVNFLYNRIALSILLDYCECYCFDYFDQNKLMSTNTVNSMPIFWFYQQMFYFFINKITSRNMQPIKSFQLMYKDLCSWWQLLKIYCLRGSMEI